MNSPARCAARERPRSGRHASSAVGMASSARLTRMPRRRSIRREKKRDGQTGHRHAHRAGIDGKAHGGGADLIGRTSEGRMAWVANRSTTVRNAVSAITSSRMNTLRAVRLASASVCKSRELRHGLLPCTDPDPAAASGHPAWSAAVPTRSDGCAWRAASPCRAPWRT